jgi:TP901 family phage tail tape measure protein
MANTNESAATNLLGNITGPLQRVADKLALTMKASKALHGGILGIGNASGTLVKTISIMDMGDAATYKWSNATDGLSGAMGGAAEKVKGLGNAMGDAAKGGRAGLGGLIKDTEKLKSVSDKAISAGKAAMGAGKKMVGLLEVPLKTAADHEAALGAIKRSTMQASGADPFWASIAPTIESQSRKTKSQTELHEIAKVLRKTGVSAEGINSGALAAAVDLVAPEGLGNEVAEALGRLGNSAGIDGSGFGELADILSRGASASEIGTENMAAYLTRFNDLGKNSGMTGMDATKGFAQLMVAFKSKDMGEGESASAIEAMLASASGLGGKIKNGGWGNRNAAGIWQESKLDDLANLFDGSGNIAGANGGEKFENVMSIVQAINEKVGDKEDRKILFKDLFGENAASAMEGIDSSAWGQAGVEMDNVASLQQKMAEYLGETASKWKILTDSVSNFMAVAGKPLLEILDKAINFLSNVINKITGWTEKHPKLAGAVFVSIAVLGSLLYGVGKLVIGLGRLGSGITGTIGGFDAISKKFPGFTKGIGAAATAMKTFSASLLTNPIGWIALAIGVAALLIYKYWEPIKKFFGKLWGWFKSQGPAVDAALAIFLPIYAVPLLIIKHWDKIKICFKKLWAWFKSQGPAVDAALLIFNPLTAIPMLIIKHWDKLKAMWEGFAATFKAESERLRPELENLWGIVEGLWGAFEGLVATVGGVFAAFGDLFAVFGDDRIDTIEGAVEPINDLSDAFRVGQTAATQLATELAKLLKVLEGIAALAQTAIAGLETVLINSGALRFIKGFREYGRVRNEGGSFKEATQSFALGYAQQHVKDEARKKDVWANVGKTWKRVFTPITPPDKTTRAVEGASAPAIAAQEAASIKPTKITPTTSSKPAVTNQGGSTVVNYNPKLEFHGNVTHEDKEWFRNQLAAHKDDIAKMVIKYQEGQRSWNPTACTCGATVG